MTDTHFVVPLDSVNMGDVARVGGKNASLGEMLQTLGARGVRVPGGFVVTADAYRYFIQEARLDVVIRKELTGLNTKNMRDLARRGAHIRNAILKAKVPKALQDEIRHRYRSMETVYGKNIDTAVRSSATAEDLPGASFAGEHETFLGIRGANDIIDAVKSAMASLFTDRAISYRVDKKFDHFSIALSVAVQRMVRSDSGASGVMFTLDTESGFRDVVLINAVWGLGEMIVQGQVTPDEHYIGKSLLKKSALPFVGKKLGVKKQKMIYGRAAKGIHRTKIINTTPTERISFVLSDAEVKMLAVWGVIIEEHYSQRAGKWTPMDIEWARDGVTKELFIVQARPETVHSERDYSKIVEYTRTGEGTPIVRGASVGNKIATGKARVIMNVKDMNSFKKGEVLVTDMTDPNWEPIMKIASAIVTDKGGRTSHAAIVSRELGIPAVVGTEHATQVIKTGDALTVDTSGSEGLVFRGTLAFTVEERDVKALPKTRTKIMVNIATPETAFEKSFLPHQGVGLAREEFIIASTIGIHPMALLNFKKLPKKIQEEIRVRISGWDDPVDYYVDQLAYGIARIGLAFAPHHVIVRFSDFKTNEYRALLGGELYEPHEENPMLGWRGASRYYDEKFKSAFLLECRAIARVRGEMGLMNVIPMVPFCRTPEEGERVLMTMAEGGLVSRYAAKRGHTVVGEPMPVYVMCEIPANILLADRFLDLFDGMSIGSNDLTQLVLGLDRDSGIVNHVADEQNQAVKEMVRTVIDRCRSRRKYIGICGQAPSEHPDFARFLVEAGIESMSLNPDTVISTTLIVAKEERDRWSV